MPEETTKPTMTTPDLDPAVQRSSDQTAIAISAGLIWDVWWGAGYFVIRPHLWLAPLLASLVLAVVVGSTSIAMAWWWWPAESVGWWTTLWQASRSLALALVTAIIVWTVTLPLLMIFVYEGLQKRIFRRAHLPTPGESLMAGVWGALRTTIAALPTRALWLALTLVFTWLLPPAALLTAFWGLGHASCRDACDSALALRGIPYPQRQRILSQSSPQLLAAGASAALLQGLLLLTVVGWLLWIPALFCAAARHLSSPHDPR